MLRPAQDPSATPLPQPANEAPKPLLAALPVHRQYRRRRWLWLLLIAGLATAGAAWVWFDPWSAPEVTYVTVAIDRGDIEDATTAVGVLQPFAYVEVGAQVSGQLRKVHVEVGQEVKEGDLLAEIDSTVLQSKVEANRAQLLSLGAQLKEKEAKQRLAQQQFDRQSALRKANATSEDAYQSSQAELASALAQIDVLKAQMKTTESNLKADQANLGYTSIHAPMEGTVVSQLAKQGQTLNANQQAPIILKIANLSTMTIQSQVSEADIGRLRVGMDVYFTTLGQSQRRWNGTLRKILPEPEIVNNVVLYNALFDVPNPNGELRTQMTAQVFFVNAKAENALRVPLSALKPLTAGGREGGRPRAQGGGQGGNGQTQANRGPQARPGASQGGDGARYRVQVQTEGGAIEDRVVVIGVANRVAAEILSGLKEGDRVVVGVHSPVRNGQRQGPPMRLS